MFNVTITPKILSGLFLVLIIHTLFQTGAPAQETRKPPGSMERLNGFQKAIEGTYASLPTEARLQIADDRVQALSRIDSTRKLLTRQPEAKRGPDMMRACSLLTDIVLLRIKAIQNDLERAEAIQERETLLLELQAVFEKIDQTHEKITEIEQGHAKRFKSDLDTERQKREQMWTEARERFSELENELIKVRSSAERTIISMSDLLFATNRYDLAEALKINLARIAGVLSVFRDLRITVEGHTDNRGSREYNQALSEKRANFVMDFLVFQGITPDRLRFAGYNFSRPVASNETPEGRQQNRRVDLVIQQNE
jgi:outer membrane protein OmpA-like peptidoglycan-associated protein